MVGESMERVRQKKCKLKERTTGKTYAWKVEQH